ncbi:WD-40 repeat-containing protein [Penicillium ucsense]|nr:WD-40 repeat-containing protein [Penicillium ucsense]
MEENRHLAALTTIMQNPHMVNEGEAFTVAETPVVNAVTATVPSAFIQSGVQLVTMESLFQDGTVENTRSAPHGADDLSTEMDEGSSGLPSGQDDLVMDRIVQDLLGQNTRWSNIATITNGNDLCRDDMIMDYESSLAGDHPSPSTIPDDDLEDFLRFYPDEETHFYQYVAGHSQHDNAWHDVNLDEFNQEITYASTIAEPPQTAPAVPDFAAAGPDSMGNQSEEDNDWHPASIVHTTTFERNLTIDEFIQRWMDQLNISPHGSHSENRVSAQLRPLTRMMYWQQPPEIHRPREFTGRAFDLQQMPWAETLKVRRSDARDLRDRWYTSYHNLDYSPNDLAERLPQEEVFFQEKSMYTECKATVEHFQLRNLMSVPASNTVQFASRSKIYSWAPDFQDISCLIDLSRPIPELGFHNPVKVSSMKSAFGLTVAGGFCGEYALRQDTREGAGAKGLVTPDFNDGITNHVDVIRNRTGREPICVFASNDRHLRVLDCETNLFVSDQELSRPINCTATSPDSRLRVVIGDSPDAWIIEADTGRPVHPLRGHRDFGFACAWSPDMRHIATSNQDKTVIIWDARTWRALETIDSDVAGYRSLRFSPVGGGPRTLLCAEPADRISIIDAQMFRSRQVHNFFGEIGGADYSPDGRAIWVANTDPHFGGFMQYERRNWGQSFGLADLPNEWLPDGDLDGDDRCVVGSRQRDLRFLRTMADDEYEMFIL